ncbi:hypothetical protein BDV26DRAFT_263892 [Aspergillus bertholletiae]|uniref:Uncharacterized protein n=1 Tax=Aspergillus bertholletiae TaxID=1226010 RepID=A0A5N7B5N1_9EURO|nr:hypothetical protein BDV26DRAFT_263892 [Aspergillus bertholletiae]
MYFVISSSLFIFGLCLFSFSFLSFRFLFIFYFISLVVPLWRWFGFMEGEEVGIDRFHWCLALFSWGCLDGV